MTETFISGVSGGVAGIFVDLVYFPIDTIKTRIQASSKDQDFKKQTTNKYKGLLSSMTASFPSAFIFFFTYDQSKTYIPLSGPLQHMCAASIAEITTNICRNPFEVVKNQMQVGLDPTIRQTMKSIYQTQGLRGFYAGFSSIILREIPFSGIQFPIYEWLKKDSLKHKSELSLMDTIRNGGIAGGIAAFFTTPFDVLKSKLMTDRGKNYTGLLDCINKTYRVDGAKGFFRAYHVRTLQISSSGVLFFGAYETTKKFLRHQIHQNQN